jgi:hypothetical protein
VVPLIPSWVHAVTRIDELRTDDRLAVAQVLLPSNRVPRGEDPYGDDALPGAGGAAATGSPTIQIGADSFGALMNLRVGAAGLTEPA